LTQAQESGVPPVHAPLFLRAAGRYLDTLPRPVVALICSVLTILVFMGDVATGREIAFSIFYLFPVVIAAWELRWHSALAMVLVAGVAWYFADIRAGNSYDEWVRVWNAAVRSGFFFVVAYTLTKLKQALAHERQLARTDSLTGLANARSFHETAVRELSHARRRKTAITIAYIDLDGFKDVNDTRGHPAGDELLQLIARSLRNATRGVDLVGRLGGDEFAIILPDVGPDGARVAFARITQSVMKAVDGWGVGMSIGVVSSEDLDASLEELVQRADLLMYEAKRDGGRTVRFGAR
jgi:diguanylate cyclase (GGDEF)-like protein